MNQLRTIFLKTFSRKSPKKLGKQLRKQFFLNYLLQLFNHIRKRLGTKDQKILPRKMNLPVGNLNFLQKMNSRDHQEYTNITKGIEKDKIALTEDQLASI